jgi:hypothetical protein
MVLEEITDLSMVKRDKYDIAFIDDNAYVAEVQDILPNLMIGKKIFLSGKQGSVAALEDFDEVITKPFLPSQITAVIERFSNHAEVTEEHKEENFIFPLTQEERRDETMQTEEEIEKAEKESIEILQDPEVLDSQEIERIKALLEEDEDDEEVLQIEDEEAYEARKVEVITEHLEADGLEIISEEEIVSILSTKPEKKKMKKKKAKKAEKKRSKKGQKEETYTFEEALIAAIEGMKPKKIKKLLKDAEVTIKINFKDKK